MIIQEQRKNDNLHRLEGKALGEYQICFDNSFSVFQAKLVFFEVFEEQQDTHVREFQQLGNQVVQGTVVDPSEVKLEDLQQSLGRVHLSLEKVIKSQTVVKHFEAVDRIIVESNFDKVNFYSTMQTGTFGYKLWMLKTGSLQRLFAEALGSFLIKPFANFFLLWQIWFLEVLHKNCYSFNGICFYLFIFLKLCSMTAMRSPCLSLSVGPLDFRESFMVLLLLRTP